MNNSQVAHVWASQNGKDASGSNFFSDGPALFSYGYHYCVARFADATVRGLRVVLFNDRGYSVTTQRHRSHALRALRGLNVKVISVPQVTAFSDSVENMASFEARYNAALLSAARARSYAEWHISSAQGAQTEARDYAAAFNLPVGEWAYAAIDPELLAKARALAEATRKADKAKRAQRERLAKLNSAEVRAAWRNGANVQSYALQDGPTMLRMRGANVETSRGAMVPASDARKLWNLVERCARHGVAVAHDSPLIVQSVGDFRVTRVECNGDAIVGCHTLTFAETSAFATAQGWNV